MSFREKSAWVTLACFVLVALIYITHVRDAFSPSPSPWALWVIALCFGAFIVIEVVAHIVLAIMAPKDARTPKDERERLIELKATRIGAYVFVAGTFLAILTPHHGATGFGVAVFVLIAFVVAEIVNYSARILYYRRGI